MPSFVVRKKIEQHEELVLNLICALTNLSIHQQDTNIILRYKLPIAESEFPHLLFLPSCSVLGPLLLHENEEVATECIRAFGNLSIYSDVSELMVSQNCNDIIYQALNHNADNKIIAVLLDHSNQEIVQQSAGVLINISKDPKHHDVIKETQCPEKYIVSVGTN